MRRWRCDNVTQRGRPPPPDRGAANSEQYPFDFLSFSKNTLNHAPSTFPVTYTPLRPDLYAEVSPFDMVGKPQFV